jgi:type I restriction enzyme S subunit
MRLAELVADGVFVDGDWVESKDQDPEGDVRLIQLADVGDGVFVDKSARFLTSSKARELKCTFLERGDILVARMPDPLGRACFFPGVDQPCVTVVDVCIVRPGKRAYRRWLLHAINSPSFRKQIERHIKGTTRQRISRTNLGTIELNVPGLPEQRRIADILDKADAIRRKRKEAIALTEELLRSAFLEMFGDPVTNPKGWPVRSVDDLCETKQYGTAEKANERHDGLPVLRMNNLTYSGEIDLADLKWVPLGEKERVKLDLRDGDVLFNRVNSLDLVGKTAVWHHGDGYTFAGYLIRLRFGGAALGDYVSAAMNMPSMKRVLMTIAKPSINMANISGSDLARVNVPVPPIAVQRKYRDFRRRVCDARGDLNQHAAEAADLFNSLVTRAFSGALESSR